MTTTEGYDMTTIGGYNRTTTRGYNVTATRGHIAIIMPYIILVRKTFKIIITIACSIYRRSQQTLFFFKVEPSASFLVSKVSCFIESELYWDLGLGVIGLHLVVIIIMR